MSEQQQALDFEAVDYTRVRTSDPATSREAAAAIAPKLGKLMARVLSVADSKPRTARELAQAACERWGGEVESYRKRARELCRAGHLSEQPARTCKHTGKSATTYIKATRQGTRH